MARKLTALQGLLDEPTTPRRAASADAGDVPTPEPQEPAQTVTGTEEESTVRSTLDLPSSRHAALLREAIDTGADVGWPVRPQHVLRAMVDELLNDPDAVARVRDRIRRQGRPTRRRST